MGQHNHELTIMHSKLTEESKYKEILNILQAQKDCSYLFLSA